MVWCHEREQTLSFAEQILTALKSGFAVSRATKKIPPSTVLSLVWFRFTLPSRIINAVTSFY